MRANGYRTGLIAGALAIVSVAVLGHSLSSAAHASSPAHTKSVAVTASTMAYPTPSTSRLDTETGCQSYVQVFENIDEDPEHAGAHTVTASYAIDN